MTQIIYRAIPDAIGCASRMPKGSGPAAVQERIDRLKAVRKRLGWSEEVCAYHPGVTYSTVNRWEQGRSVPKSRLVLNAIDRFLAKYQKEQPERG